MAERLTGKPVSHDDDGVFAELVNYVTAKIQAGEEFDLEAFTRKHPDHAERLRQLMPTIQGLAGIGSSFSLSGSRRLDAKTTEPIRGNIGDYRIIRELGRGGMGVVFEAEQHSVGRRVALKILPFVALLHEHQLERFATEATAAARLQQESIVTVYSVGCERGIHFIAMQLIEGPSLAEVIAELRQERHPCDNEQQESADTVVAGKADVLTRDADGGHYRAVARIGREAADALQYAHENGVLHRDIKPSNLLLDKTGHVWIADFGLARIEDESQLTRTGDILGTLRYMSPEQATGQRDKIDARSDVYGLGATLYELATLRPVFDNEDRGEVIKQVLAGNPVAPHKVDSRIPQPLSLVISKSMARLDERYQSAEELADDLRRYLDGEPVHARAPSSLRRVKTTLLRQPLITLSSTALLIVASLYIPNVLHRLGTNEPDNSSVTSSTDTGDSTMFRSAPKKRTSRKNERIRQLRHEQLEDRRLLAGVEIGIDDVIAIEGKEPTFVDVPISPASSPVLHPKSIVRGPDDNFYVTSSYTQSVLRYDGATFAFIDEFVESGSGGMGNPIDLAFANGSLFVSDNVTNSVLEFDLNGDFLGHFVPAGANGLDTPKSLLVNDGSLFVCSWSGSVHEYDIASRVLLREFGETDPGMVQHPSGLAFGPDGNLYVSEYLRDVDKVLRYDADGNFIDVFIPTGSGGLEGAAGIAFGPGGDLYVVSERNDSVRRYDGDTGEFLSVYVSPGEQGIDGPVRLLFDGGQMLINSRFTDEILRFAVAPSAVFNVSLSSPSGVPVTVDYDTAEGTAKAGEDYETTSGTLTFAAGETSMPIIVPTVDDDIAEGNEAFTVTLSEPTGGATIPDGQGTGTATIIDYSTFPNNTSQPLKDAKNPARPGVTISTIDVGGLSSILDLNVAVDISHSYVGQLSARLIAPDGTPVELFSGVGGSDDNFTDTVFDDEAAIPIASGTAPFTGTFRPAGSLAVLDDTIANGEWKLEITDNAKGARGTLNSWALDIAAFPVGNTPPVADYDNYSTNVDEVLTVAAPGVLENDRDDDGDTISAVPIVDGATTEGGQVTLNSDGSFTYTPNTGFAGNDSFSYTVSDGNGGTDTGLVEINVSDPSAGTPIYVYDIRFESKRGNKDWRAVFEIRSDSNDSGGGDADDSPVAGVAIHVTFNGQTLTGVTDSDGIFRTEWQRDLAAGTYHANVTYLDLDYSWITAWDMGDNDDDGDGKPDNILEI